MHIISLLLLFEKYPLSLVCNGLQFFLLNFSAQHNFFEFFPLLYMLIPDTIFHITLNIVCGIVFGKKYYQKKNNCYCVKY